MLFILKWLPLKIRNTQNTNEKMLSVAIMSPKFSNISTGSVGFKYTKTNIFQLLLFFYYDEVSCVYCI